MKHVIYELKARHGHMIGIDDRCMAEGMAVDYEEVARLTGQVTEIVKEARLVEVQAPSGTDVRAKLDPSRLRWHPCPGIYHSPGEWGNLPEGETFTSPAELEGVLGAEILGDHFSEKYGVLETPMRFEVAASRVRKVAHPDDAMRADMEKYLAQQENSNRAGEFAIGTNVALNELSGNLLQDEKIPGVHVAFGHPYPEETGADWDCPSHCDVVATRSTIKVDGQYLMRNGEFVI
jgi:leucyl aminopeptidase (aminopeptidase T)